MRNSGHDGRVSFEELQIAFASRCAQSASNAPISCGRGPLKSSAVRSGISRNPLDKLFVRRGIYQKEVRILDGVNEELRGRSRRQTDAIGHPPGFRSEGDDLLLASCVDRVFPRAARRDETSVLGNRSGPLKEFPATESEGNEFRPKERKLLSGERSFGFEISLQDVKT